MYGSSSRPFTVEELLVRLRRAAGDRCGAAVDKGARQLQKTGLGDGWAVDQEGLFDREAPSSLAPRPLGPLAPSTSAPLPLDLSALAIVATATAATATATTATAAPLLLLLLRLLLLLPSLSQPLPPRTPPSLPAMTSLRRSGGSGDGASETRPLQPSSSVSGTLVGVVAVAVVAIALQLFNWEFLAEACRNYSGVRARPFHLSNFMSGTFIVRRLGGVDIFTLDNDDILTAMYALSASAEGDCSRCVPPDPSIAATALGASESGTLPGLYLPSLSMNLVSTAALQDAMVTTTTPGGQHVSICTCTRTGRYLATFTRRPGSSLYTLATEPPQVAASAQVSALGQVAASCSCRLLSHQTLLWHHRLGHPSLPRLCGLHSRLLVSGLPRSLPPVPPSPAPPCLPCVKGRQRAAPHSSSFPPMTAPLQTLHMDVKGEVVDVLIPWIRTVRLQLRERFGQDLSVLRLHSDRGGEFSSNLLRSFCRGEGILQSFTLPDSPQQNGIVERRIGLVMEVARTVMTFDLTNVP
ncbi:unnamed protein product [Closterium sp. NIES-54]